MLKHNYVLRKSFWHRFCYFFITGVYVLLIIFVQYKLGFIEVNIRQFYNSNIILNDRNF